MPTALTIAGSDSVGGAGLQADLKAFEALGVHGCTVVTCVTSQNTKRVASIFPIPPEEVLSQLDSVLEDVKLGAIKTGMLYDPRIVEVVSSRLKRYLAPLVVDPVLAATTGSSLRKQGLEKALIDKLIPKATLVTPNVPEASRLSGVDVRDERTARKAAAEILGMGARAVLVKGGHLKGPEAADYLFTESGVTKLATPRAFVAVHGTGCALASLIAGHIALGNDVTDAVKKSKVMIYKAIISREIVGRGVPCANPLAVLRNQAERISMLEKLEAAGTELENLMDADLIPEVGSNMGYATLAALEPSEVAAFDGRIVRIGRVARRVGCAKFGASKHVARIVIAAGCHDTSVRCALNIKYSDNNLDSCRRARLTVSTFDRAREPKGVSSMTWGVHKAIQIHGKVPDVIFDRGGVGKEPMIRILGKDPDDVLRKLRKIKTKR
jgi:hydroxymethylpyrimidine/phosphomethylpyrimidine kinase